MVKHRYKVIADYTGKNLGEIESKDKKTAKSAAKRKFKGKKIVLYEVE